MKEGLKCYDQSSALFYNDVVSVTDTAVVAGATALCTMPAVHARTHARAHARTFI